MLTYIVKLYSQSLVNLKIHFKNVLKEMIMQNKYLASKKLFHLKKVY